MLAGSLTSITQTLAFKIAFPLLSSSVNNDRHLLKQKLYKIRSYFDFPVLFVSGLLIAIAPLLISLLYDDRYKDAGWMLQILVFSVVGNTLTLVSQECLSALAMTKVRMWIMLARTIGLLVGLPIFFNLYGIQGAIWVVSFNVWLALPIIYSALAKNDVFSWFDEIKMLPIIAVGYAVGKGFVLLIQ
jgi:O-antigen/teichoic acid export membrane protein